PARDRRQPADLRRANAEMDTAGGPAADIDDGGVEETVSEDDVESAILPAADQMSDMGVVPLSLLEAEAAAEAEAE
ncbi:signal recognition particle-docking protein FtsY, partial [Rhizobium leguminosarum]